MKLDRVLVADAVDPEAMTILKGAGIQVTALNKPEPEAGIISLFASGHGFDGIIVRSATKVTKGIIAAAPSLAVIGRAGVGVDNIDIDAATRHNVLVLK